MVTQATIVPAKPEGGCYLRSFGTKVLTNDGELHGISNLTVHFTPGEMVRAEVELYVGSNDINGADLEVWMFDPYTNEKIHISSITTTEGRVISF